MVPDLNAAGTVLTGRDFSFEIAEGQVMIFDFQRQAGAFAYKGQALGNGPALEDAISLQPAIVVVGASVVFLDDESQGHTRVL